MRIPIAIYTAIEGYAWQPGTELSIAFLNEAKKVIGKFPDASMGNPPFGGSALVGDKLVVYRYHLARGIDSFGRDALYVVLGAVQRADAALVNIKYLLEHPSFAAPHNPLPEMSVDYDGPGSDLYPPGYAKSFSQKIDLIESLPWLGDLVAERKGTLLLACSSAAEPKPHLEVAYEPPPPPTLSVRPTSADFEAGRRYGGDLGLRLPANVTRRDSSVEKFLFLSVIILCTVLLAVLIFRIPSCRGGREDAQETPSHIAPTETNQAQIPNTGQSQKSHDAGWWPFSRPLNVKRVKGGAR